MIASRNGRRILFAVTLALMASPLATPGAEAAWWSGVPKVKLSNPAVTEIQTTPEIAQQSLRIDRLEDQMRQLNGRLDELTYQIQQLQDLVRRSREDTEFRFQELEGGTPGKRSEAPTTPQGQSVTSTGPSDVPVELGSGFSMDADNSQFGQPPQVLGTISSGAATGALGGGGGPLDLSAIARGEEGYGDSGAVMPSEVPVFGGSGEVAVLGNGGDVQSGQLPPPTGLEPPAETEVASVAPADPRALYDEAYDYILAGDYELAETGFRRFLKSDDRSPLAGDANFWLGESLYARGQFRDAADSFLTTYRDFPTSQKAPESLLKLGLSLEGLGETEAACATYRELEKKYSTASAALLNRVANQKSKAGC